jgi:hypothetical protein
MRVVSFFFRLIAVAWLPAPPLIPQLSRSLNPCGSESQSRAAQVRRSVGRDRRKLKREGLTEFFELASKSSSNRTVFGLKRTTMVEPPNAK